MRHGLPDGLVRELRAMFPRTQIAALVDRMAAFKRDCFASVAYLAEEIGRSKRQTFRYVAALKERGFLRRVMGPRDTFPEDSSPRLHVALRAHGYAYSTFSGELRDMVHRGQAQIRAERSRWEVARERREEAKRKRRQQKDAEHERWKAQNHADYERAYPDLARKAKATERREVIPTGSSDPHGTTPTPNETGPPD